MAKRLILSDLHFGDRTSLLRKRKVVAGLREFLWKSGPFEELILAGDILKANLASLTTAIEGKDAKKPGAWPTDLGFRRWLADLFADPGFRVGRIVYIPGNHDYVIWNLLATQKAFMEPLAAGLDLRSLDLPLMEAEFPRAFLRGALPPRLRERFLVSYPDYEFQLSSLCVLVTHGHYFDGKQTLRKTIDHLMKEKRMSAKRAAREVFIATAQY